MCMDCGCGAYADDHGDARHLTLADIAAAADASGVTLMDAAANIISAVTALTADDSADLSKGDAEQRFLLGVAYEAGPDPRIKRGADGGRDYFTEAELEKAAWSFMLGGQAIGAFHIDGTEGAGRPCESYIYRNPVPWVVADDLIVRKGDWVLGAILDDQAWQLHKAGKLNGWSPQGTARRRRRVRS